MIFFLMDLSHVYKITFILKLAETRRLILIKLDFYNDDDVPTFLIETLLFYY